MTLQQLIDKLETFLLGGHMPSGFIHGVKNIREREVIDELTELRQVAKR